MRAADWDREQTVEVLRQAYAEGRLELAELNQRTDTAFRARTFGELRGLIGDLPRSGPAASLPPEQLWQAVTPCPPRRAARQPLRVSMLTLLAAAVCVLIGAALSNTAVITVALTAGLVQPRSNP
jgi:hypothetical protein